DRTVLLGAGRHRGPDAFAPASASFATGPLSYQSVQHHEPDGPFRQVVGRLDPRGGDEPEVGVAMQAEAIGQVPRLAALWGAFACGDQLIPRLLQGSLEACRVHL